MPSGNLHAAADTAFLLSLALVAASVALNGYGAMAAKRRQGGGGGTAEGAATGAWEVRLAAAHPVHDPTMAGERLAQVALEAAPGKAPDHLGRAACTLREYSKAGILPATESRIYPNRKQTLDPTSNLKWFSCYAPAESGAWREGGKVGAEELTESREAAPETLSEAAAKQDDSPFGRYKPRYQVSSTFYSTYSF